MEITKEERRLINNTYSRYPRRRNTNTVIPELPCAGYIVEAYTCNSEGVAKDWHIIEVDLVTYAAGRRVNSKEPLSYDFRYVPPYFTTTAEYGERLVESREVFFSLESAKREVDLVTAAYVPPQHDLYNNWHGFMTVTKQLLSNPQDLDVLACLSYVLEEAESLLPKKP